MSEHKGSSTLQQNSAKPLEAVLAPMLGAGWFLWTTLVLTLNATPANSLPKTKFWFLDFPHSDKIIHFIMYFGVGGLFCAAVLVSTLGNLRLRTKKILFVLVPLFIAAVDELNQLNVPGRSADPLDYLADAIGIAAGVSSALLLHGRVFSPQRTE
ncbi:MAG: VanZ family protein [Candidatus Sumerlaeia bacterium]|nr:VanZ family protein [Candidatus Sumerlaeia bacterium]